MKHYKNKELQHPLLPRPLILEEKPNKHSKIILRVEKFGRTLKDYLNDERKTSLFFECVIKDENLVPLRPSTIYAKIIRLVLFNSSYFKNK